MPVKRSGGAAGGAAGGGAGGGASKRAKKDKQGIEPCLKTLFTTIHSLLPCTLMHVCSRGLHGVTYTCPVTGRTGPERSAPTDVQQKEVLPNSYAGIAFYAQWQDKKNTIGKPDHGKGNQVWTCSQNQQLINKAEQSKKAVNFDEFCKQDGNTCMRSIANVVRLGRTVPEATAFTELEEKFLHEIEQSNGTRLHKLLTFFCFLHFCTPEYLRPFQDFWFKLDKLEGRQRKKCLEFHDMAIKFKKDSSGAMDACKAAPHTKSFPTLAAMFTNRDFWVKAQTSKTFKKEHFEPPMQAHKSSIVFWAKGLALQDDQIFQSLCKDFKRKHVDLYNAFVLPYTAKAIADATAEESDEQWSIACPHNKLPIQCRLCHRPISPTYSPN
jgi:hypothetical protein